MEERKIHGNTAGIRDVILNEMQQLYEETQPSGVFASYSLLEKMADYYDEEVELATQSLMAALEPMVIVILACIVGVLVGAVVSPMLSLYTGLENL